MKRKITAALILTLSVMTAGSSVFAQSTDAVQTQTSKTALEQNMRENSSIITGIVKSVNEDSITIETMAGGRGGFKNISGDEGERPEKPERPVIAEGTEDETADVKEARASKERPEITGEERPEREKPDTEAIDIEKTEREKPEAEEKTITVSSSTLIYKADSSDKTQIDLSEISEGDTIRVQISDDSNKSSDTVLADEITYMDKDDMPEKPEGEKEGGRTRNLFTEQANNELNAEE